MDMVKSTQRDIFPQILRGTVTESSANTFTEVSVRTPVSRFFGAGGKALVMEILKVVVLFRPDTLAEDSVLEAQLTAESQTTIVGLQDSSLIARFHQSANLVTSGAVAWENVKIHDLQAGGKGLLYGGDEVFFGSRSSNQTAARVYDFQIIYRLVEVDAQELIGIIESFS